MQNATLDTREVFPRQVDPQGQLTTFTLVLHETKSLALRRAQQAGPGSLGRLTAMVGYKGDRQRRILGGDSAARWRWVGGSRSSCLVRELLSTKQKEVIDYWQIRPACTSHSIVLRYVVQLDAERGAITTNA